MFLTEEKRELIRALRHGPLNPQDIALEVDRAPFYVRAELAALKRDRLVHEITTTTRHVFELTDRGWAEVYSGQQQKLPRMI